MLSQLSRCAAILGLLAGAVPGASAANPKDIDAAVKRGADALKARYTPGGNGGPVVAMPGHGIGPTALAGLALLEAGVPVNDPALKTVIALIRDGAYTQHRTYQVSLCLMFLDRLGEPADVPLIQMLAVRLLAGQTRDGGWGYDCCSPIGPADDQQLRAALGEGRLTAATPTAGGGGKEKPKLHPDVEKYGQLLTLAKTQPGAVGAPLADNSNTQFALLAVWMARKHGVPAEATLALVEKRFVDTQNPRTGGWPYTVAPLGPSAPPGIPGASPSMHCAGLLAMATAVARREERQLKNAPPAKADAPPKAPAKSDDPFYNPPAKPEVPKPPPARHNDEREVVIQRAVTGLGQILNDKVRNRGLLDAAQIGQGHADLYFLWSLERVGVVYNLEKFGDVDWYDAGSTAVVRAQNPDGTWTVGQHGAEVNTAFAILFLRKANLARDLSSKKQSGAEMRAGGPSAADLVPPRPANPAQPVVGGTATPAPISLPNPTSDPAIALAATLFKATGADWSKQLAELRDGKGTTFTRALVVAAENADGDRKKQARAALAERLCRMTAGTLRGMLKADEAELRRAAALACAMKDDKGHVADLVGALEDRDEGVWRAAKAGLKSLTGQDLGPATEADKPAAVRAWREWLAKQKK